MKNEYKAQLRYERRKAKRLAKKRAACADYDNFDKVFTYTHMNDACKNCKRDVMWKPSVQSYLANRPLNLSNTLTDLRNRKFRSKGFFEFDIFERGKVRHIQSVTFRERVVQRCLCDYSLVPMLSRKFIYDNGASMKGKGYTFSVNRLTEHLHRYYRKHGSDGYILIMDFSKYFDNIPHEYVKKIIREEYTDERLVELIEYFIDCFKGDIGLGLGSQISQILALLAANELDHYIKEKLGIKYYARYMDDSYLIHPDKKYLQYCLTEIQKLCEKYGIVLNPKKVRICKLTSTFTFLKVRFSLTKSGQVVRRVYKKSVVRMRRKLKKFKHFVETGYMTVDDVYCSYQSWRSHAAHIDAYHTIQNMERLFISMFGTEKLGGCHV